MQSASLIKKSIIKPILQINTILKRYFKVIPKKKIVILGTGWGSYSLMKSINKSLYDVVVVSPRNYFLFTPLLCSTTTGTVEPRSIIEPIRSKKNRKELHQANATNIDLSRKQVSCQSVLKPALKYTIDYDILAIGVGAVNNTFNVPGVKEHAFFLKEIHHAQAIRDRLLSNFELSVEPEIDKKEVEKLLTIVIVGGGPTGVEFGAEVYDFIQQDISKFYQNHEELIEVKLIESHEILSSFDKPLKAYAEKTINRRKHFNILNTSVTEVTQDGVWTADKEFIPSNLVVWSTGLAPHDVIKNLDIPKSSNGRILTDSTLRVLGDPNQCTYAYGDCAEIEGTPLPPTAQVAERQGRFLALNTFNVPNKEPSQFHFKNFGMLAYIGGYKGLSDLPAFKLQGLTSYILWRSAYLTRLGSWRLRLQVVMDWTKTIIYGRDISRFKM